MIISIKAKIIKTDKRTLKNKGLHINCYKIYFFSLKSEQKFNIDIHTLLNSRKTVYLIWTYLPIRVEYIDTLLIAGNLIFLEIII